MTNENEREVYRALREAQTRYTYFMLAAAGAAIALALKQTETATLAGSQAPLAIAVLCWGMSFFAGSRNLAYVGSTLFANLELLRVERGGHPELGQDPQMIAAASGGIREAIESNSERANQLGHWQFQLLVAGAVAFVAWHIWEMYLRTN